MGYIGWSILAMVWYGATAIVLKLALRDIPAAVAATVANTMLVGAAISFALYRGQHFATVLKPGWPLFFLVLSGVTLSVSVIAYYQALSKGPASVVAPIFSMSFVVASVLGMLLLGEPIKATRIAGIVLGAAALVLVTR